MPMHLNNMTVGPHDQRDAMYFPSFIAGSHELVRISMVANGKNRQPIHEYSCHSGASSISYDPVAMSESIRVGIASVMRWQQ
jgi:hypothetical protein